MLSNQGVPCIFYSYSRSVNGASKLIQSCFSHIAQISRPPTSTPILTDLIVGWRLFSAPEPKAQVHYCDHALSVARPYVVRRLSSLTFHIFNFSSETTEQNSTKLDRKQYLNVLYQTFVFRVDRKNKIATLASDWLRHFRLLLWNHCKEFKET